MRHIARGPAGGTPRGGPGVAPGRRSCTLPRLVALLLLAAALPSCSRRPDARDVQAKSVGAARCAACHREIAARWKATVHGNAGSVASPATVRGDFEHRNVYVHRGVTSRMWSQDGKYFMETEGADGLPRSYPIDLTLGWRHTQVYLTRFPDGRYQLLPTYYDLDAKVWYDQTEGIVPSFGKKLTPRDHQFWTNRGRTFNAGCEGCHSSRSHRNYDLATGGYNTTWDDLAIDCEACHGPGSVHAEAWTRAGTGGKVNPKEDGLIELGSLSVERQVDACAVCHALKTVQATGFRPGDRLIDSYQPAVPGMEQQFFSDGRNKGLNYSYIEFIQSACHRKADLACTGCHDPHGSGNIADLREPEKTYDNLCTPCHRDKKAGLSEHTRHPPESPGSTCIECHMPFVDILGRFKSRDHSIGVPVPALTKNFGVPNACNTCHKDRDPDWAIGKVQDWFDTDQKDRVNLAAAFHFGFRRDPAAAPALLRLFRDPHALPLPRRAGIPLVLAGYKDPSLLAPLITALQDPEESLMVRYQVAAALASVPSPLTDQALLQAVTLREPALRRLAGIELARRRTRPRDPALRKAIDAVVSELEKMVKGERAEIPEEHASLGDIYAARGQEEQAIEEYRVALKMKVDLPEVQIRLGTLYARRKEAERAAECFRTAADLLPDSAIPLYNLGSLYLSAGRYLEGMPHLSRALAIDPDHQEARYNLAVAQVETGSFKEAVENLRQVVARRPRNPMARYYLGRAYEGSGQPDLAAESYRKALEISPDLPEASEALSRLGVLSNARP